MKKRLSLLILALCFGLIISSCIKSEPDIKLFPIKSGDKWGYIDKTGKYIINPQFERAFNFSDGLALVSTQGNKHGFIGEDGKYAINPIYKDATKFSEGLACVVLENGKPQFINREGKIMFTVEKADWCYDFRDGLALIKSKGKWGFIDKTGKIIINPIYDDANSFKDGLASVAKIDEKTKEKKWGFIDKTGGIIIGFQFVVEERNFFDCEPNYFREGLAFVSGDGKKWGCIGTDGKYKINPQFDGVDFNQSGFKNGFSIVSQGGSFGYIDKKGKFAINPQFKEVEPFSSNGLAAVQHSDGKWGFINKEGKYEINPQFDGVSLGFVSGIAFVKSSGKYGIIDKEGLYIVNPVFDDVMLQDIEWTFGVKSDFVDNDEIASEIFDNSRPESFLGYGSTTTLADILNQYPEKSISDLEPNFLSVGKPKTLINEIVGIKSFDFGFLDKTYTETPIYKSVQKYSYWSGYYWTQEFDRWDKKIQLASKLAYVSLGIQLQSTGKGKGKALADAIKRQAKKAMNVSDSDYSESGNTDERGIHILRNQNTLLYIIYTQKVDDSEVLGSADSTALMYPTSARTNYSFEPSIVIAVVNSNYSDNFDEIAQSIKSAFERESF
jgi:hypothetical protein